MVQDNHLCATLSLRRTIHEYRIMETLKLKTVDDLLLANQQDQRIKLINGEIVKRPMARSEYALAQAGFVGEVFTVVAEG